FKDYEIVLSTIKNKHQEPRINTQRSKTSENAQETSAVNNVVYENVDAWEQSIQEFTCIEFGSRSYLEPKLTINYKTSPQPNFNQQFNLLAENLQQNQKLGLENFILAESTSQFERLAGMFEELDINVHFKTLSIGLSQGYIDHQVGIACYT
ncbi:transcription-repair coupling factor, partial [Rhizobium leguminosarum]|nr:transcription-repair coupling factor [Rhizobium leguminosarum]